MGVWNATGDAAVPGIESPLADSRSPFPSVLKFAARHDQRRQALRTV